MPKLGLPGRRPETEATVTSSSRALRSPYLEGPFAPIDAEITADDPAVIGEIPRDLSGMFVRNGANPRFEPIGRYHWFDGDGMLHGVHLADGRATYRNRYVRTRRSIPRPAR
jgi:carotenoid cleavage dioxygenase-like enzyme